VQRTVEQLLTLSPPPALADLPDLEKRVVLATSDFFRRTWADTLEALAERSDMRSYAAGAMITETGDTCRELLLLVDGAATVQHREAGRMWEEQVRPGHVLDELLKAGFDAVYDDPVYDVLEGLYDSGKWANDLDALTFTGDRFHQSLRYAENHDEVRLANPQHWGGLGMKVGRPVSAVLFAMGKGPIMLYNGQEVGEPAIGSEGFGGDDGRSSIFDYGSMPEFSKWTNQGKFDGVRLSPEQKELRSWYAELLGELKNPAFTKGDFYGLNHANNGNPAFGRLRGETASGHWLYAFLRRDPESKQAFVVVANFHGTEALKGVRLRIPEDARNWLMREQQDDWVFDSRFGRTGPASSTRRSFPRRASCFPSSRRAVPG
jgi:hypothetical protein